MKNNFFFLKIVLLLPLFFIFSNLESLPVSTFIITPSGIDGTVYKSSKSTYRLVSADEEFTLPGTASQKIISEKTLKGKKEILLSAGESTAIIEKEQQKYLKNTQYLNTDKKSIQNRAAHFRSSKNPVVEISDFVYRHISDKKIGMSLIPAESILSQKSGDCKHHSILTISLLRAINIPARAVVGLILTENFSGKENVFVYHMWTEAYYNGKWILVDSTRPGDIRPNRYIAFAYHNLTAETPLEYLQALSSIRDIEIHYIK